MFTGLDHVAIVVPDTDEALKTFRDKLGLTLLYSEVVNNGTTRLTHLDAGNTHVQLVQPLTPESPLHAQIAERGIHLHHICFKAENVDDAMQEAPTTACLWPRPNPIREPRASGHSSSTRPRRRVYRWR